MIQSARSFINLTQLVLAKVDRKVNKCSSILYCDHRNLYLFLSQNTFHMMDIVSFRVLLTTWSNTSITQLYVMSTPICNFFILFPQLTSITYLRLHQCVRHTPEQSLTLSHHTNPNNLYDNDTYTDLRVCQHLQ